MGKEQDLLVAVKTGDLLLTHKLLTKVKCSRTSESNLSLTVRTIVLLLQV